MRHWWIVLGVLVADQVTKVAVRLNMADGGRRSFDIIGDVVKFTFTENSGMAFGFMSGSTALVTTCSIVATVLIILYLVRVRAGYWPYTCSLAFILGGAIGNIIDRLWYGLIFGYAPFYQGHVVDFIHINVWYGIVPSSVPLLGGQYLALIPIFNVADIAICGGVAGIVIFQKQFQRRMLEEGQPAPESVSPEPAAAETLPLPDQT